MPTNLIENAILRRLTTVAQNELGPYEKVSLSLGEQLEAANVRIEFVYFLDAGIASVVADHDGADPIEVGLIGREGMSGIGLMFGDTQSPFSTHMQTPGSAYRIAATQLRDVLLSNSATQSLVLKFARTFLVQVAATASANGRSNLEERLARWLVMFEDRVGHSFGITHQFLSTMLSVRRASITEALQALERQDLIRSTRGHVEITNRLGLIASTHGAYGLPEREYARLFPENENELAA